MRQLQRLPITVTQDILDKIEWLSAGVENIRHARLKGSKEFSLHSGQYRVIYNLDRSKQHIEILDVGKHDTAYRRLRTKR